MRVLIIGGGIGGLCLAQGLRQAGVDVTVHERDETADGRNQGYRLRISPEGEQALRDCLPPALTDLLVATSNQRYDNGLAAFDENLVEQWAPEFGDPRGDRPDKVDAVDRVTLRRILLAGLSDIVHFGRKFDRCEQLADGRVRAHFADGGTMDGDVLVAADGANSRVRALLRPDDQPRDLGVRTVFSRIPMADAHKRMPSALRNRFTYIIGSDGHHFGLMPMVFRTKPSVAAAKLWPGLSLHDADDYYMSVFNVHRDELGLTDEELFGHTGADLCRLMRERTTNWHEDLREVVSYAEPDQTFAVALRAAVPVTPWEPGNIVPLGDAVHTMPPSGGVGANTAVCDAAGLTKALAAVARGERPLTDAVADYQAAMVGYATPAAMMSLKIAQWSIKKLDIDI